MVIAPSARLPVPGWDRDGRSLSWAGPDTMICCLTPYGLDGPLRDRRATQLTAYAGSGGMWSIGPAEGPPRTIPAFPFYDELSAQAAFCIMVALRERPHVGGQVIDLCLHDLLAYRESTSISYYTIAGRSIISRQRGAAMPPTGIWDVSDGQVELLIWNPPHWDGFLEIVGRPQDLLDPVLRQRTERFARADQLAPRVRELLAPFTMQGLWDLALAHRVPCAPVNTILQVTRDPQLASRGFWAEHDRPGTGRFRAPGRPLNSSVPLLSYRREAPLLGEHDQELLGGRWAATRASQPWSLPDGPRLADLKVLSFGTAIAGNVSATTLAELGADVVKIESPDRPDPLRLPGFPGLPRAVDPSGREFSLVFSSYSRSGRTLTLDMKSPAGLATFARLAAQADVLIDNFATGVMAGWGLTPEALAAMNPRLIWVSVSGYGRTGPRATAMAYGSNVNGYMGLTRTWSPHGSQFDYTAVAHVLITIFAALAHRDRTGQGSHTEIAQAEAGGVMLAPLFLAGPGHRPGRLAGAERGPRLLPVRRLRRRRPGRLAGRRARGRRRLGHRRAPAQRARAEHRRRRPGTRSRRGGRAQEAHRRLGPDPDPGPGRPPPAGRGPGRRPGRRDRRPVRRRRPVVPPGPGPAAPPGHRRHHLGHRPVPAPAEPPSPRPLAQPPPRPAQRRDPPRLASPRSPAPLAPP